MAELVQGWDAFWALPHIRAWLTAGWMLYLAGLGLWIVLQKREPAATLSWLVSLAALPYIGFAIYYVFGPQKITRHRARWRAPTRWWRVPACAAPGFRPRPRRLQGW
ncbi:MAG: hypothetical protein EOP93_21085, partial [Lysobacteraceae bacterium]